MRFFVTAVESILSKGFKTQERLAEMLGVRQNVVSGWHTRDSIPHKRQREIIEKGREIGIAISPSDFFPESETA
jgi:ribosome-binding protein aMBF1 (putative translation factor)